MDENQKPPDVKHAILSPSAAHRWLNCTPSARLEMLEPERPTSVYALEGTEAHELAYIKLSYMLGFITQALYETLFKGFIMKAKFYNAEFNEYVNEYCEEVMNTITIDYQELYEKNLLKIHLEVNVNFEDVVPEGSGTSDVLIVGPNFIHCIDLKYGKGVAVDAHDNPQLRLYVLGGLKKYRLQGIFTEARMTIIQPRLNSKSTDTVLVSELNEWALNYVKPRAELAFSGKGELTPGSHCKFCARKGKCEALADAQLEAARKEFEIVVEENKDAPAAEVLDPRNMTPEMIARVLEIAPKFQEWFESVKSYARREMLNGLLKIPGFKIVRGKSNRVMTDPDAIAEILRTSGFSEDDYMEPRKLLGLTALEKNVGKSLFNSLAGDYIVKPEGAPTVVPESDKRPALEANEYKLLGQEFDEDFQD